MNKFLSPEKVCWGEQHSCKKLSPRQRYLCRSITRCRNGPRGSPELCGLSLLCLILKVFPELVCWAIYVVLGQNESNLHMLAMVMGCILMLKVDMIVDQRCSFRSNILQILQNRFSIFSILTSLLICLLIISHIHHRVLILYRQLKHDSYVWYLRHWLGIPLLTKLSQMV